MRCEHCGAVLAENAERCPECGNTVWQEQEKESFFQNVSSADDSRRKEIEKEYYAEERSAYAARAKKRRLLLVVLAVVGVLLLVVLAVLGFSSQLRRIRNAGQNDLPALSLHEQQTEMQNQQQEQNLDQDQDQETAAADASFGEDFADVLWTASSGCSKSERLWNIWCAGQTINGTIVAPGESFSFLENVGEPTEEAGYVEGEVYPGDDSLVEQGGGISQLASALYECCLYADMELTQRNAHELVPAFAEPGLDAYVHWKDADLCFVNTLEHPIRIDVEITYTEVRVSICGTAEEGKTVEVLLEQRVEDPCETIEKTGEGEDITGVDGGTWILTRHVTYEGAIGGRVDNENLMNQSGCGTSVYHRRDAVIYSEKEE